MSILFYMPEIFHDILFLLGTKKQGEAGGGLRGLSSQSAALAASSEAATIQAAWQGAENHETDSQEAWAWHRCAALRAPLTPHLKVREPRGPTSWETWRPPGIPPREESAPPTPTASLPRPLGPQPPSSAPARPRPSLGGGAWNVGPCSPEIGVSRHQHASTPAPAGSGSRPEVDRTTLWLPLTSSVIGMDAGHPSQKSFPILSRAS